MKRQLRIEDVIFKRIYMQVYRYDSKIKNLIIKIHAKGKCKINTANRCITIIFEISSIIQAHYYAWNISSW